MKLYVQHRSVRFCLKPSDILVLRDFGECRQSILFPDGSCLEYVLSTSTSTDFNVAFSNGVILLTVPVSRLKAWHLSDQVTLTAEIRMGQEDILRVLMEKDVQYFD
jgi:hypothetical protein